MNAITPILALTTILAKDGMIASIGSPGSGKSTFFDQIEALPEHKEWLRLERDRFREALFGSRRRFWDVIGHEVGGPCVRKAMLSAARAWPHHRYLLTDTGGSVEQIAHLYKPLASRCVRLTGELLPLTLLVFNQPLEVLLERNETRPAAHRVDPELLTSMYDSVYGPDAWWRRYPNERTPFVRVIEMGPSA